MKCEDCGVSLNKSLKHPEPKKVDKKPQGRPIGRAYTCSIHQLDPTGVQWGAISGKKLHRLDLDLDLLPAKDAKAVIAMEKQGWNWTSLDVACSADKRFFGYMDAQDSYV